MFLLKVLDELLRYSGREREKRCEGFRVMCSKKIKYNINDRHVPTLCWECQDRKKGKKPRREHQEHQFSSSWQTKTCTGSGCYNTIKYKADWKKIPDLCPSCIEKKKGEWLEKPCKACGKPLKYKASWEHIPNYHKECKNNPNPDADSVRGFESHTWVNPLGDTGKVLSNSDDPDSDIHLHHHKDGTTISKYIWDPQKGEMVPNERYNFNTGEDEMSKKKKK